MPRPENAALYKQYEALREPTPNVHFAGRLATYKYYNMDQVVAQALTLCAKLAGVVARANCMRRARATQCPSAHTNRELISRIALGSNFIRRS